LMTFMRFYVDMKVHKKLKMCENFYTLKKSKSNSKIFEVVEPCS
jgi:hypothetical protein